MQATTNYTSNQARSKINNLMSNSDNTIAYGGASDSRQAPATLSYGKKTNQSLQKRRTPYANQQRGE